MVDSPTSTASFIVYEPLVILEPVDVIQTHTYVSVVCRASSDRIKVNTPPGANLIVDWDRPNEPYNPKNWSFRRKWATTTIVSSFTFISLVSSSMVASTFGIHNDVIIALTTPIFVLAICEVYGRSRLGILPVASQQTESQLLAFRFLAGLGGSAPLSIGSGVLGDCWRPAERGKAMAILSLAPLLGPVVGPITGAWIAERSIWRWVFWSTSVVDAVIQILGLFVLRKTYAPLLLGRKAASHMAFQDDVLSWRTIMAAALSRPFALFVHEPIVQLLGVYMAYLYGTTYLFLTTIPSIFQGIAGFHYIALSIGLVMASQLNARTLDKIYVHLKSKHGEVGKPEFRLPAMFVGTILLPIGCLTAGWTTEAHTHWIAPDIGIVLVGAGIILNWRCLQTYVVDCFTRHAASALAAVTCLQSLAGFGFPLFAAAMYNTLGVGKGNIIIAVVAIAIGCPAFWIFWHYGERIRIRNSSRYARS
ncbi:MFS polyamine transporter [Suillus lakei]|nr:MFS polyamine transporter [Suillus lakei]